MTAVGLTGPIISAGAQPLTLTRPGPSMRSSIQGMSSTLVLVILNTRVGAGGDVETRERRVEVNGFFHTRDPRELKLKFEGNRKWRSKTLYTLTDPQITLNNKLTLPDAITYRVMAANDWSQFGFWTFDLLEDYRGSN